MRPQPDLSLYLVTDTALCGAFGVPQTAARAVAGGVGLVQLRDPTASDDELVRLGRALRAALAGTGVPLVVDDRVHLVEAIGADGAHVGQTDLEPRAARALLGPDRLLGLSVQRPEHVAAALALPPGTVDHLGAGPVFAQTTKPDAAEPIGLDGLADLCRLAGSLPCVAIGGIDAGGVAAVRAAGAAGAAVVSAICGRPDPEAAARALRDAWSAA